MKTKTIHRIMIRLSGIMAGMSVLMCAACADRSAAERGDASAEPSVEASGAGVPESEPAKARAESGVTLSIEDYYITNTGNPANLYYIDEENVLWGSGRNNYGQLGQGIRDDDFHGDFVRIAEDVIHVDFSQSGFTIYLTKDHRLYGMGNAGCGALQQYRELSPEAYQDGEADTVNTPILLMEGAAYARCGRDDVVCMTEDGAVWVWGTIVYGGAFSQMPVKVLENAALVTGGPFSHAALLRDGSVWTWGYNYAGNCGVADNYAINSPTQVAEGATMVWTGSTVYNIDCRDISELGSVYEPGLENTILQKEDGTYWACGVGVGTERTLKYYWGNYDFPMICTPEFVQVDEGRVFSGALADAKATVEPQESAD